MTRQTKSPEGRALDGARFVLATDLDGTFLGGSERDRRALYDWIETHRDEIGLVFVTGRDPRFIADLCDGTPVPWPDYVVGDVGTTIAAVDHDEHAARIRPIEPLEAEIAERWGNAGLSVRAALGRNPGLKVQPTEFRYRVSFDYDPETYCRSAEEMVTALGLDFLISDNRYFDVLPRGVSKGPSLRRLIAHLRVPEERVLVAGDTLNDLSMLESGLKAVAVGGSEPALLERVAYRDTVHRAEAEGAAGIAEAIRVYDLFHTLPGGSHVV